MEFEVVPFEETFCPAKRWRSLRPAVPYTTADGALAPDQFLWGVRVSSGLAVEPAPDPHATLWVWDRSGGQPPAAPNTPVRVIILSSDQTELAAFGLYLKTSFQFASAQDVEWVTAIQTLTHHFKFAPAEKGLPPYWKEALLACGLEPHLGVLAQRSKFIFLNESETQLLFHKKWDLSTFELFETFPPELRSALLQTFLVWSISASHAKESVHLTLLLFRKFGLKTALHVLAGQYTSADQFRNALFQTAQPELAVLTQRRIELLRGLHAPARSTVFGDPSFEKDIIRITHTPKNMQDVETFRQWLSETKTTDGLRALLEIYQ